MNVAPDTSSEVVARPPGLIQSLLNGFNAVATHIYLILFPAALDLLLWFGPHLRIKTLLAPSLDEFVSLMQSNATGDMLATVQTVRTMWQAFLDQFNLVSLVSTFPVGVPSLFGGAMPVNNPLGAPAQMELHSMGQLAWVMIVLILLGLLLGSLYFGLVAQVTQKVMAALDGRQPAVTHAFSMGGLGWQTGQVLVLILLLLIVLFMVLAPALAIMAVVSLISGVLSEIVLLLAGLGAIWLLLPLIFSPQGIFLYNLNAPAAIMSSARIVRTIMPGAGLFLLAEIVINQGLGMLWSIPPATSWMALVGVLGHAFIVTALLAASFVYYRGGLNYIQALQKSVVSNL